MKKYILLIYFISTISCSDFLDKSPSKNTQIEVETAEQLDALFGNYYNFFREPNKTAAMGTDDFGLTTTLYNSDPKNLTMNQVKYSTWGIESVEKDDREAQWSWEYTKIFSANLVLSNLSKVSGSESLKELLKQEAHFIRAVSYWQLVNTFCLPYAEENFSEPGVVLKSSTSFEEPISRSNLKATYEQIESDLMLAMENNTPIITKSKFRPWRISRPGVRAFAARFYFYMNDNDKAEQYADEALAEYSELVDYNTEMGYYEKDYAIKPGSETIYLKMPVTWDANDAEVLSWKEMYYSRYLYNENAWYIPSEDLLNLYKRDSTDLRYRYHMIEDYSYYKGGKTMSYPGYAFFGQYYIPSGPTVPEMMLIKSECLIRKGKWQEGMQLIEKLRLKRIDKSAYTPFEVKNEKEALSILQDERRREMPFSKRWFDIRRRNHNADPSDDVNLKQIFYPTTFSAILNKEEPVEYKLGKGSRRWAQPIPYTELISSQGAIKQNQY